MALALSTKAKIVAATLTATTLVAGAFSASAQQMAAAGNSPNFAACDQIKDPAKSAQCSADASREYAKAKLAAANVRLASAEDMAKCIAFLKTKKTEGAVLAPERLNREKGCAYAAELGMK